MNKYLKNRFLLFLVLTLVFWLSGNSITKAAKLVYVANTNTGSINNLSGDTIIVNANVTLHANGNFINSGVLINQGTLKIDGTFTSTVSGQSYNFDTLMVAGDFLNASSVFLYQGKVFLNGVNQNIITTPSAGLYFYNFAAINGLKTLRGTLIVGGQFDLQGVVTTNNNNDTLGLDSAGYFTGLAGFTNHYIIGPMFRRGRDGNGIDPVGMVFPVAEGVYPNANYRPAVLYSMPMYKLSKDKPIIKVEAHAGPSGGTYGGGTFYPRYWDINLINGKLNGGAYVELGYNSGDVGGTASGKLAILGANSPTGVYSSLGNLASASTAIISYKKDIFTLGVPTTVALGVGCTPVVATLNVPKDTVCTGSTATFNVITAGGATYDSVFYFVNSNLKQSSLSGATFTYTPAANDTVSALILKGLCVDTMNKIIMRVVSLPNAGPDQTICAGNKVTLAGTSTGGFKWKTSGSGTFAPNAFTLNATYTPSAVDVVVNNIKLTLSSTVCPAVTPQDFMNVFIVGPPTVSVSNVTSSGMKFSWPLVSGATGYSISINHGAPIALGAATLSYTVTGQSPLTIDSAFVKSTLSTCQSAAGIAADTTLAAAAVSCDTSWTISGAPFCIASIKSKLVPTVSGGVFTGTGVTFSGGNYYFDPAVTGPGTFNVTYTRASCSPSKSLTKPLVVNDAPCFASITPVGTAAVPLISNPEGIASDCNGSVYFSDTDNNAVWGIDPFGNPSVMIGDTAGASGDGTGNVPPASGVKLFKPEGLIAYNNGDIYFADAFNNKIKKYTKSTGAVTVIAGPAVGNTASNIPTSPSGTTSTSAAARFLTPSAVTIDLTGNILYVADRGNKAIKKIDMISGTVTYIATTLSNPASIALYGNSLYFSMPSANAIGVVDLTTNATSLYYKLPVQPTVSEQPTGLSVDCQGKVYYSDAANGEIRLVTSSTTSSLLLGGLNNPTALSVYNKGFIDIANSGSNQILRYAISNWKTGAFNGLDTTHCIYDVADVLNPLTCNVAGGFSFSGNGIQLAGSTYSFSPSLAGIGRHKIVYKFNAGFCQDSLIEYVNVYPRPKPNLGANHNICSNLFGLDTLHAGKDGTKLYNPYQWLRSSTGANGSFSSIGGNTEFFIPTLPVLPATSAYYAVQVTDTNGCVGSDTVIVNSLTVTGITISGTPTFCYGSSTALTTQPGGFASYLWNTGSTSSSLPTVTASGDYIVNATAANGCISADTFRVTVNPLPNVCISAPPTYRYGVWSVSTLAGTGVNGSSNTKGAATFSGLWGAYISNGILYISEEGSNNDIRQIKLSDTTFSTFAGITGVGNYTDSVNKSLAKFNHPYGMARDSKGNYYFADRFNHIIRKIDGATGFVSTIAGTPGINGYQDGSKGTLFNSPHDIAIDGADNIYVADYDNFCIRKITSQGVVSTFAGQPGVFGTPVNGIGAAARFNWLTGIDIDISGNLYVADWGNNVIRKITPNALVSTFAGGGGTGNASGFTDGAGTAARFNQPFNITLDKSGNVLVSDLLNHAIRKINKAGNVVTLAGKGSAAGNGFVDGDTSVAKFYNPRSTAINSDGRIFVTDWNNRRVRTLAQNKTIALCPGNTVTVDASCSGANNTYSWTKKSSAAVLSSSATYTINATGTYIVTVKDNITLCQNTDSVIVIAAPLPLADAGPDETNCGTYTNKQIGTAAILGNTYAWTSSPLVAGMPSSVAQPIIASIPSTTTFTLTVTGANGCTNTDVVLKKIIPMANVSLGKDTSICAPSNPGVDSMMIGPPSAGYNYVWSSSPAPSITNTTTPATVVKPSVTTTYYLTATDPLSGCVKKDTVVYTVNPLPPTPNLGTYSGINCRGTLMQLGVPGDYTTYSYSWTTLYPPYGGGGYNDTTRADPTYLLMDTLGVQFQFTVTYKATGCSNTDFGGTTVRASPRANFTHPATTCFPASITYQDSSTVVGLVTDANDVLNSWKWYFGDGLAVPPGSDTSDLQNPPAYNYSMPGTYVVSLVVKTGNNCIDSIAKPVIINALTVGYTAPSVVCSGTPVTYSNTSTANPAGTLSCVWDFGDGSSLVNTTNNVSPPPHVFPLSASFQTYNVTLQVTANGCTDSYTQSINVNPFPVATITPPAPINACQGNTVTLNVPASYSSAPYQVVWRELNSNTVLSPASQVSLPVTTSGIYRATIMDTLGGCADSSSATLNFLDLPAGLALNVPSSSCSNAPLKLISSVTAGDSLQYVWTTSNGSGIFSNSANDTTLYTPSATDVSPLSFKVKVFNSCKADSLSQSVNLLTAATGAFSYLPSEPFMNDLITFIPDTSAGGNIAKWAWNFQDGTSIDSVNFNGTHSYVHSGSFPVTLTLTNNVGCPTVVTNFVDIPGPVIYIPNVFEPSTVNPENSVCKVYGTSVAPEEFSFKIFDKWGSIVYQTMDFTQANQLGWNGKNMSGGDPLPMGVYTWAVKGHFYDGTAFEKAGTVTLVR